MLTLFLAMNALFGTMVIGAVGWGFTMERRAASMESSVKNMESDIRLLASREIPPQWFADMVKDLRDRVRENERTLHQMGKRP